MSNVFINLCIYYYSQFNVNYLWEYITFISYRINSKKKETEF